MLSVLLNKTFPSLLLTSSSTEEDKQQDLYEIPIVRQSEESSLPSSPPADSLSVAVAASVDDITEEVCDTCPPPPLPPRRDRTVSETTNRSTESIASSDRPPDLPARPPLHSLKSDTSSVRDKPSSLEKSTNGEIGLLYSRYLKGNYPESGVNA